MRWFRAFSQNQDAVGGTHGFGEVVGDRIAALAALPDDGVDIVADG